MFGLTKKYYVMPKRGKKVGPYTIAQLRDKYGEEYKNTGMKIKRSTGGPWVAWTDPLVGDKWYLRNVPKKGPSDGSAQQAGGLQPAESSNEEPGQLLIQAVRGGDGWKVMAALNKSKLIDPQILGNALRIAKRLGHSDIATTLRGHGAFIPLSVIEQLRQRWNLRKKKRTAKIAFNKERRTKDDADAQLKERRMERRVSTEASTTLFEKGEALFVSGDLRGGVQAFRNALDASPDINDRIYNFVLALRSGAESKNNAVGGNIYFSDGVVELDAAISVLELLSEFEPKKADLWFQLGLLYDNRCYSDEAVKAYGMAGNLDPEGPDGADALHNLAILYVNKGRGRLGTKAEDLSGVYVYDMISDDFVHAERLALNALSIAQKVYSRDSSFRDNLIKVHLLLIEIYNCTIFEDGPNGQGILKGESALKHCLEIYKLDPSNSKAISWLKTAEKNTGRSFLTGEMSTTEPVAGDQQVSQHVTATPDPEPARSESPRARQYERPKNYCDRCRREWSEPSFGSATVDYARYHRGACPNCEGPLRALSN